MYLIAGLSTALCFSLLVSGCTNRSQASSEYQQLSEDSCVPYGESAFKPALPAEWQPYLVSTRVCPLVNKPGNKPAIVLVAIFIDHYYRDRSIDEAWEKFPKPVFFNADGRCVARPPDLYPTEPPRDMEIMFGKWQGEIPGEIRTHVLNPAVGGDFDLPNLVWDTSKRIYIPVGTSFGNKKTPMECLWS